MSLKVEDEQLIVSYLLGTLPEEEQVRIEERFLRDAEYRETIRAVEDDLIDEYVRGELRPSDRELFEERFVAHSQRRRKVEFARALVNSLPAKTQRAESADVIAQEVRAPFSWSSFFNPFRIPGWAWGFSLAALVLVGVGLWLLNGARIGTRKQSEQLQAQGPTEAGEKKVPNANEGAPEDERQLTQPQHGSPRAGEQLAQKSESEQPPLPPEKPGQATGQSGKPLAPRPVIASFVFSPGIARNSDESRKLTIPAEADLVRLQLDLERGDEYHTYGAELRTIGGRLVWQREMLRSRATAAHPSVVLDLPAQQLTPGDYELKLTGATGRRDPEELGYYYFSIVKR